MIGEGGVGKGHIEKRFFSLIDLPALQNFAWCLFAPIDL